MPARLKDYFHAEIIGGKEKPFSWRRVLTRAMRSKRCNYMFWFRIAYVLHRRESRLLRSLAKRFNNRMVRRYGVEVMLGAEIDEGFVLPHPIAIVVAKNTRIGKKVTVLQNTTIGNDGKRDEVLTIGDNVFIGANCCIIGSGMRIGNNVNIGAMSYVDQDIPDDTTFITQKEGRMITGGDRFDIQKYHHR
ncbi:MAG: DapH/DapD/GlmU-related protein [Desulfobacterales bacterium]|jgi:serine acetyltransferase